MSEILLIKELLNRRCTGIYKHNICNEYIFEFDHNIVLIIGTHKLQPEKDYWNITTREKFIEDDMDYKINVDYTCLI